MKMYIDKKGKARAQFNLKELLIYFSVFLLLVVLDLIGSWIWGIPPDIQMMLGVFMGMIVGPIMIISMKGIQMEKETKDNAPQNR